MDERVQNKLRFDQIIFATQSETHRDLHTTYADCMSVAFPRIGSMAFDRELDTDTAALADAFSQQAKISTAVEGGGKAGQKADTAGNTATKKGAPAASKEKKTPQQTPNQKSPQTETHQKPMTAGPTTNAAADDASAASTGDPKTVLKTPTKGPSADKQGGSTGKKTASAGKTPLAPIYIAPRLGAAEADALCAAGVLLYRFNATAQQMEVLMGLEFSSVSLLGGKRSGPKECDVDTASREFYEEAGGQVNVDALRAALRANKNPAAPPQAGVEVCWLPRGKYALYLVNVDAVPGLRAATDDVDQKFARFVNSVAYHSAPHDFKEMSSLRWMPAARFVSPPFPKSNSWAVSVFSAATVKEWIVKTTAELKPHLTTALREKIESERDKATGLVTSLQARLKKYLVPIPPVAKSQVPPVSDLTFLTPSSAEYQKVAQKFSSFAAITAIKKVNVASRLNRFNLYTQALPSTHSQIEHSFHGTASAASADAIARKGPDLTKAGQSNGTALGSGFYTTQNANTAFSYCKGGSICLLRVAPGVSSTTGDQSTTASSLASLNPPCSSVTYQAGQDDRWFILFHSDAVVVDYIVTFGGHAGEGASEEDRLRQQAYEKKVREWEAAEKAREAKVVEAQSQLTMVDYFVKKVCDAMEAGITEENSLVRNAKFDLEVQQFTQKLPMYGRKGEFLDLLKSSQTLILQGGTGIGKTVTVPQWCLDNLMCALDELPSHRVAVLVPRKAIATAMAQYLCQLRHCTLGEDVGYGTGDEHKYTDQSRIVFFTYGFFAAIPKDKTLSKWGAIVMDEFHERAIGADVIWPMVIEASRARSADNFKVVVMSATIDTAELAGKFTIKNIKGKKVVPQILEVPGVTYSVEDIWWDGEPWDPASAGALDDLCCEVQRVFNHEESGNVLVFLSKVSDIHECVKIMSNLLRHDRYTDILPLSASLPEAERDRVQHFNDLQRYPGNARRRLICFSTNVAEAGVTIPGITAVVDTGREINVTYDLNLKANVSEVSWISQASQLQRRGRAGRTAPGRCYCMYSQEDFSNMPEFSTPRIMKANCAKFYLSLVANDMNPAEIKLFDCPEDRMEAAKQSLLRLKAIAMDSATGAPKITKLGEVIYRLPVDISLAKSIIAGADCNCSEPMAVIAAVLTACEVRSLFVGSNDEQVAAKQTFAAGTSGDHETALRVYEAWSTVGKKRRSWATQHYVSHDLLQEADEILSKIHQILSSAADIAFSNPAHSAERSAKIVESIVHGFPDNIAVAKDPNNIKEQFSVVEGSETNPLYAKLLPSAALVVSQAQQQTQSAASSTQQAAPVEMVVYHSLSSARSSGEFYFKYATAVPKSVVEKVGRNQLGDAEFSALRQRLSQMARDSSSREVGPLEKHELEAFRANLKELNREFAHSVIKTSGNCSVHVACLASEKDAIWKRIMSAIKCAKDDSQDIYITKSDIRRWLQGINNKLTKECQAVRDALRAQFLGGNSAPKAEEKVFTIQFVGDYANSKITVRTNGAILDEVAETAKTALGENTIPGIGGGGVGGKAGGKAGGGGGMPSDERLRLETLLTPTTDYKALMERIRRTPALGGRTIGGSLLVLAHAVIWQTNCWIYGGYLRDFMVRGETHDTMDLDIGLPKNGNLSGESALSNLIKVMSRCGIDFNLRRKNAKGPHVYEAIFNDQDNHTFSIEFVNAKHYMTQESHVDFDGCNLMVSNAGEGNPQLRLKYPGQGGDVATVCANIRQKKLVVIRNINKMSERIDKMKQRGWKIVIGGSNSG